MSTSVLSLLTPNLLSTKNEIDGGKQGQYQKLFWAKGPNFGGEMIVSLQCFLNCKPLRLWFQELSQTPYMTGINTT